MTINNNNKNITLVKKGIEEELNQYEPKELNNLLWDKGLTGSYGPLSTEYLVENREFSEESVDFVKEHNLIEDFQDYYFEWNTHTSAELATTDEDLLKIKDEEERWNTAHDWTDDDGFVWCGFENYIHSITDEVLDRILDDKCEEICKILKKEGFDPIYERDEEDGEYSIWGGYYGEYSNNEFEFTIIKSIVKNGVLFGEESEIIFHKEDGEYGGEITSYKSFDDFLSKLKELKIIMNNNNILEVA